MKVFRIGRGSNNDYKIDNPVVSAQHAVITVADSGDVFIEDCGSKNGTYVNGVRINAKTKLVAPALVLLGNHSIDWMNIIQSDRLKTKRSNLVFPPNVVDKKLIGRNSACQISFSSYDDVSDKHAYLCKLSDGMIVIIDNDSTNGTYVNGTKISGPYYLKKGDMVNISGLHPFNWEAVYPVPINIKYKPYIAIAVTVALLIVLLIIKPWDIVGKGMTRVYEKHKNDVVMIFVRSTYAVTVQGKPLSSYLEGVDAFDYCYLNSDGDICPGMRRSSGTGFFISKEGKILTNRHVVTDMEKEDTEEIIHSMIRDALIESGFRKLASNISVDYVLVDIGIAQNDTYIDKESDFIPCTIITISDNDELDVALIQTNTKTIPKGSTYVDIFKAVPSDRMKLGYKICTIGFPLPTILGKTSSGLEANNQSGEITQVRGYYEYGHNITIHQGASGSPVYDSKGRFAGMIVSGFLPISQGYNQAICPTPIVNFISSL